MAERTYTVPLRRGFRKAPRYKRTIKAVRTLKLFLVQHMKVGEADIRLGQHLNEFLWQNGIKNPPGKVVITTSKDKDGIVRAELEGKTYKDTVKPQERQEQPQGLKEKLQAAVGKKDTPETEEAVAEAQEALKSDEKPAEKKKAAKKPATKKAA